MWLFYESTFQKMLHILTSPLEDSFKFRTLTGHIISFHLGQTTNYNSNASAQSCGSTGGIAIGWMT
jgi:hypothetical protein